MKKLEEALCGFVMICVAVFGVVVAAITYPILLLIDWLMGNKIQ